SFFIKICANTFQEVKKHQLTADVSKLGCICAALFIRSVFGSPRPAAELLPILSKAMLSNG
ncbi:hypothetical protein, partial [Bacillus haynesii]|uniref:hypothetical protein n=1 Tax=Bacillus haynesii TaxID=1925021 RepID=UPI002282690C